jgi:hypothetical protein
MLACTVIWGVDQPTFTTHEREHIMVYLTTKFKDGSEQTCLLDEDYLLNSPFLGNATRADNVVSFTVEKV